VIRLISQHRAGRSRRGFTLLEILLVLAIMVAVMALAAPAFSGVMENQRLRTAADMVRTEWTRAHVRAMKTGRIQVFRYQIGASEFKLEPWAAGDDTLEAAPSNGFAPVQQPVKQDADETSVLASNTLPEGITFLGGDAAAEARSMAIEESLQGISSAANEWSRPIMFYPDGATSDAFVIVASPREVGIRVDLRGMTGTATMSEISALKELF